MVLWQIDTTRSFYIVVEFPKAAVRGEQIAVQIAVFNYWHKPLEASRCPNSRNRF